MDYIAVSCRDFKSPEQTDFLYDLGDRVIRKINWKMEQKEMSKHFTTWMQEGRNEELRKQTTRLLLVDGSSLSVQASEGHYCAPRCDLDDYEQYYQFEIGYPSVHMNELTPFQDGDGDQTSSVFGYVPKEVIEALIDSRGGVQGFHKR